MAGRDACRGSPDAVLLIPFAEFREWLEGMGTTEREDCFYWHVVIFREGERFVLRHRKGEGDAFSDIEFAVFIRDEAFEDFPQRTWLEAVSPVAAYFVDDFSHHTALFENGVRGEFHFMRASEVPIVESWQGHGWFPSLDAAVLLDRTGDLSRHASVLVGGPPPRGGAALVEGIGLNLLNLMLLGANLLNRGEFARAWALLGRAHEYLLKLVRLSEGTTDHWPTPSRALEKDLSAAAYDRYLTCTTGARPSELSAAYRASWEWSRELFETVGLAIEKRRN